MMQKTKSGLSFWETKSYAFMAERLTFAVFFLPVWLLAYWVITYFQVTAGEVLMFLMAWRGGQIFRSIKENADRKKERTP